MGQVYQISQGKDGYMKHINPIYKTHDYVTPTLLRKYKFHKNLDNDMVYRFVVYRYKNRPLIFCDFIFDEEEKQIHINCFDSNNTLCNYNKEEFGKSDVTEIVNQNIFNEIVYFIKEGVIVE